MDHFNLRLPLHPTPLPVLMDYSISFSISLMDSVDPTDQLDGLVHKLQYRFKWTVLSPKKCVHHGGYLSPACLGCNVTVSNGGDDGHTVQQGPRHTPLRGLLLHGVRPRLSPVITLILHLEPDMSI